MAINQVIFNNLNFWEELGCAPSAPVSYPIPTENVEMVKIKGADGSLTEKTGYFNNLEVEVDFRGLLNHGRGDALKNFHEIKRRINLLFYNVTDNRLYFSQVPNRYYKVKSFKLGPVTQTSTYEFEFSVTFNCDPFLYDPNEKPVTQQGNNIQYNGDIPNQPVIKLGADGEGNATLTCNGEQLTFRVEGAGEIEINNNPYSTVTFNGTPIVSEGKPPLFTHGTNSLILQTDFGWKDGRITIIKNERYLG